MSRPCTGKKSLPWAIAFILLPVSLIAAEKLPKADRVASNSTPAQEALIKQGSALHDLDQYDEAIAIYTRLLKESPDLVDAMYELAFSYSAKQDYENAIAVGRRGAQYRTPLLGAFHSLIASSLDDLGRRQEAIEVYKAAIKQSPRTPLLHYNYGLTLIRTGKHKDAKKALQQSLSLNPNHATSHFLLASTYERLGYRIPAMLAWSRFLMIEPTTSRSRDALQSLERLMAAMGGGVSQGNNPNEINIVLTAPSDSHKDEGDFGGAEMGWSLSAAVEYIKKDDSDRKKDDEATPFTKRVARYAVLAENMSSVKGKGFAARFYAPFFAEMDSRELVPAFVHEAFQSDDLSGAAEWRGANEVKLQEYQSWLSGYRWPASQ